VFFLFEKIEAAAGDFAIDPAHGSFYDRIGASGA